MANLIDVLIPAYQRTAALAATLTSLTSQSLREFRVVISDQNESLNVEEIGEIRAISNILKLHGNPVSIYKNLPRKGMAEQRQFLLGKATAPYGLFIDADLVLEPYVLKLMLDVIRREGCGFVGCAVIGLSYRDDHRPREEAIELWEGRVLPETILPGGKEWDRHRAHNAANILHIQQRLEASPENPRTYKVAWIGGCVLFNLEMLRKTGGFGFWEDLPPVHSGEDVLAQLRVMQHYGGCGVLPSGVYHLELPTTLPDRSQDAPSLVPINSPDPER